MKTLSEMLEIDEGVEFIIIGSDGVFKIQDNVLTKLISGKWQEWNLGINELMHSKIMINNKILPNQILIEKEKTYLENILKPFKGKVKQVYKILYTDNLSFIYIKLKDGGVMSVPYFEKDKYYNGMESEHPYTLEELGLFRED